jgi:Zn-finger nucleic acid-binding protein
MSYMHCPRCGLSVRLRASWLTLDRCPRCLARRGVSVTMMLSDRRAWPARASTSVPASTTPFGAKPDS